MPNRLLQTLLAPVRVVGGVIEWTENFLGLLFGVLLALGIGGCIVTLLSLAWAHESWRSRSGWITAGLLWLLLDVPYLWRLATVARLHWRPFALQTAMRTKLPPLVLRPIIGLWWLAHFALGVGAAMIMARVKNYEGDAALVVVFIFFMVASYGYAANGFLMLAVCVVTPSERIRRTLWQFRFLTDIGLAILGLALR
jgi:hypothetical protein